MFFPDIFYPEKNTTNTNTTNTKNTGYINYIYIPNLLHAMLSLTKTAFHTGMTYSGTFLLKIIVSKLFQRFHPFSNMLSVALCLLSESGIPRLTS